MSTLGELGEAIRRRTRHQMRHDRREGMQRDGGAEHADGAASDDKKHSTNTTLYTTNKLCGYKQPPRREARTRTASPRGALSEERKARLAADGGRGDKIHGRRLIIAAIGVVSLSLRSLLRDRIVVDKLGHGDPQQLRGEGLAEEVADVGRAVGIAVETAELGGVADLVLALEAGDVGEEQVERGDEEAGHLAAVLLVLAVDAGRRGLNGGRVGGVGEERGGG